MVTAPDIRIWVASSTVTGVGAWKVLGRREPVTTTDSTLAAVVWAKAAELTRTTAESARALPPSRRARTGVEKRRDIMVTPLIFSGALAQVFLLPNPVMFALP